MSVVNTGENKLQKCNGLLKLGSVITSCRVVKESITEDAPFEQKPKRDEQSRACGYLGREHSHKQDSKWKALYSSRCHVRNTGRRQGFESRTSESRVNEVEK